jgi:hypothetical protein
MVQVPLFLFFDGTEISIQGFVLAKQELYHLSHASSLFCSGYSADGVVNYFPGLAANHNPHNLSFSSS